MSEKSLKVTDRRMFTADGELREPYRDLDKDSEAGVGAEVVAAPEPPEPKPAAETPPPPSGQHPAVPSDDSYPHAPSEEADGPGFFDLVGLLAEPATIYLKQAHTADPQSAAQSLELARLHIDLLNVLQSKTRGNLSSQEDAMLQDVIYQLRAGFVGMRS